MLVYELYDKRKLLSMKILTQTKAHAKWKAFITTGCTILLFSGCMKDDTKISDPDFVLMASMSNTAEINAGQLAMTKGSARIAMFGQMMVTDHTNSETMLKSIAANNNLYAPDSVDAEHVMLKNQLMGLTGRAFDSVYIHSQVKDHRNTIDLFQRERNHGNNQQLRDYASSTLPTLQMHLHMADSLAAFY